VPIFSSLRNYWCRCISLPLGVSLADQGRLGRAARWRMAHGSSKGLIVPYSSSKFLIRPSGAASFLVVVGSANDVIYTVSLRQ